MVHVLNGGNRPCIGLDEWSLQLFSSCLETLSTALTNTDSAQALLMTVPLMLPLSMKSSSSTSCVTASCRDEGGGGGGFHGTDVITNHVRHLTLHALHKILRGNFLATPTLFDLRTVEYGCGEQTSAVGVRYFSENRSRF